MLECTFAFSVESMGYVDLRAGHGIDGLEELVNEGSQGRWDWCTNTFQKLFSFDVIRCLSMLIIHPPIC